MLLSHDHYQIVCDQGPGLKHIIGSTESRIPTKKYSLLTAAAWPCSPDERDCSRLTIVKTADWEAEDREKAVGEGKRGRAREGTGINFVFDAPGLQSWTESQNNSDRIGEVWP